MQHITLKPLSGMKVLVTRPTQRAHALSERLRALGAIPIELPTIEIAPPENYTQLDEAIMHIRTYDWIIFTSVHGVQFFLNRLNNLNIQNEVLDDIKLAAVGPATAAALASAARKPDYVPEKYLTEAIAPGLGDVVGKRILLPRADIASKRLPEILRSLGAKVEEVAAYRTILPSDLTRERLASVIANSVDLVTFTSPSTVRNLSAALSPQDFRRFLKNCKVACIGPVTVQAAEELGVRVDIVAKYHTLNSFVEEIVNEIRTV